MTVDPFRCRLWELHDRMEEYVTEESCRAEIESVSLNGQLVPAIGRRVNDGQGVDVEIICGARRLFIARHLRLPLRVELRDLDDQQAAAATDTENMSRRQVSPYERGVWLARVMSHGLFKTQEDMARALGLSPAQVSRLVKFSSLPAIVLDAFQSPTEILESWVVELHARYTDLSARKEMILRARALTTKTPRLPAKEVNAILLGSSIRKRRDGHRTPELIKDAAGTLLLRVERRRKEMIIRVPNTRIAPAVERELTSALLAVLAKNRVQELQPHMRWREAAPLETETTSSKLSTGPG